MKKVSFGLLMARYMLGFGFAGLAIGGVLYLITRLGTNIPVVVGETTYDGPTSSLMLFAAPPIMLAIVGAIAAAIAYSIKKTDRR